MDGVEVIAALLARNQLDAGIERLGEPQGSDVVVGHGQQELDIVVGTNLGESPCRVACGSDDQHTVLVLGSARANGISLGLLERTSRHRSPDGGIITVERNPEVFEPEVPAQPLAAVSDGRRRTFEHPAHGQPVGELVEPEFGGPDLQLLLGVSGPDERRCFAGAVLERPAFVLELAAGGHAFERIGSGNEFFHLSEFWVMTCGF